MLDAGFWLSAAVSIALALGLGQRHRLARGALWIFAAVCFVVGIYRLVSPSIDRPSINVETIDLNITDEKVCLDAHFRNSGAVVAETEIAADLQIVGTTNRPPVPPASMEIVANGGVRKYGVCIAGPWEVARARARAPVTGFFHVFYHGDSYFSKRYTRCVDGRWDFDSSEFIEDSRDVRPCSQDPILWNSANVLWWASLVYAFAVFFASLAVLTGVLVSRLRTHDPARRKG